MKIHKPHLTMPTSTRTVGIAVLAAGICAGSAVPTVALAGVTPAAQHALAKAGLPSGASPYGEVARFGGFDSTGKQLGKFVLPVGFAVDPSDNSVYVLDRIVAEEGATEATLQYRLQKLSSSGTPLASVVLPAEHYKELETREDARPLMSLAVDSAEHRVYALVQGIVNNGFGKFVPVAQRLVAWSTKPEGEKLVKAPGFKETDEVTGGALVAGASVLQPAEITAQLYQPQALTVDPANHNVIIEAQAGVKRGIEHSPMVLQRVVIEGAEGSKVGKLGEHFTAESIVAPENQLGDGLFTAPDGSLGIDMWTEPSLISKLADVQANFKEPNPKLIAEDKSANRNLDQAATIDNPDTIAYHEQFNNPFTLAPYTAGTPITQLTNGLYAARYAQLSAGYRDTQSEVEPWNGVPVFWYQGAFSTKEVANEGIRLFTSNGTVITTIGGQSSVPCNINNTRVALAAGSKERLFAITQPNPENGNDGDEVIEFAPGGKGACPQPTGTVAVNGKTVSSITVKAGEPVTLADTVERKGESPYRFDWWLLNGETLKLEDLTNQMQAPQYSWPAPSTSHTFTQKGTYYLASTLYGDYGVIGVGGVVEVKVN